MKAMKVHLHLHLHLQIDGAYSRFIERHFQYQWLLYLLYNNLKKLSNIRNKIFWSVNDLHSIKIELILMMLYVWPIHRPMKNPHMRLFLLQSNWSTCGPIESRIVLYPIGNVHVGGCDDWLDIWKKVLQCCQLSCCNLLFIGIDHIFSVTRRSRSSVSEWVSQWVTLRTELTDVTLVSEDTYWGLYWQDSAN